MTLDGWSAALGTPILGMTWQFIDEGWMLRSIPIATLNLQDAAKSGVQLCYIMEEVLTQNSIIGSDHVPVFTATSDNEAATALNVDLLTNYVGSVSCTVHTIAVAVNDVFKVGKSWQKHMDHINKLTKYCILIMWNLNTGTRS